MKLFLLSVAFGICQVISEDVGYPNLPRAFIDVNGDGQLDFCRFVGDHPKIFISCKLSNGQSFESERGIDLGYDSMPRKFVDGNNDGKPDFCRYVGDRPLIRASCLLAGATQFRGEWRPQFDL